MSTQERRRMAVLEQVKVRREGRKVAHQVVPSRPQAPAERPSLAKRVAEHGPAWKPGADHPLRRGLAVG